MGSGADYGEHSDASHAAREFSSIPSTSAVPTGPGRGRPKGSTNSNKNKNKAQKSSSLVATVGGVSFNEPMSSNAIDSSAASRQPSAVLSLDQEVSYFCLGIQMYRRDEIERI